MIKSTLSNLTVKNPVKIYKFLKSIGSKYIQFIPIVEREVDTVAAKLGLDHAAPPNLAEAPATKESPQMSEFAVPAEAYGDFLIKIFNEWIKRDVGKVYVQLFDVALGKWLGSPGGLCYFPRPSAVRSLWSTTATSTPATTTCIQTTSWVT